MVMTRIAVAIAILWPLAAGADSPPPPPPPKPAPHQEAVKPLKEIVMRMCPGLEGNFGVTMPNGVRYECSTH